MTTNRTTRFLAVSPVRIRVACERQRVLTSESETESLCPFQVSKNSNGSRLVIGSEAVKYGGKPANSKGYVGVGSDGNIVQASYQFPVRRLCSPFGYLWRDRNRFVGALDVETSHHGGIAGMSISLIEVANNAINEGGLRERDGVGCEVTFNRDPQSIFYGPQLRDILLQMTITACALTA